MPSNIKIVIYFLVGILDGDETFEEKEEGIDSILSGKIIFKYLILGRKK